MIEWNVYYENFNARKIEKYNIFRHYAFLENCIKFARKYKDDKEKFLEEVRRSLMYFFWAKCEWEIIMSSWPERDDFQEKKIDVYDQVMNNWHVFSEYIWEHKKELSKTKRAYDKEAEERLATIRGNSTVGQ